DLERRETRRQGDDAQPSSVPVEHRPPRLLLARRPIYSSTQRLPSESRRRSAYAVSGAAIPPSHDFYLFPRGRLVTGRFGCPCLVAGNPAGTHVVAGRHGRSRLMPRRGRQLLAAWLEPERERGERE